MGLIFGGVCSTTELLEFSRTESKKWSTFVVEEEEDAAVAPPPPEDPSKSEERLPVGDTARCGVEVPSCVKVV